VTQADRAGDPTAVRSSRGPGDSHRVRTRDAEGPSRRRRLARRGGVRSV